MQCVPGRRRLIGLPESMIPKAFYELKIMVQAISQRADNLQSAGTSTDDMVYLMLAFL